jgi:4-cresol dehydrogenase (hydroxylating)
LEFNTIETASFQEIIDLVGRENFLSPGEELDHLLRNTSHFSAPLVLGRVRPSNQEELQAIVTWAAKEKVRLYTYSRGLNWGLGSRLPLVDHCLLVELSKMDKILEINEKFHYAIVEPGVSQEQLSAEIAKMGLSLMLNVTGSHPNASVLANTLERGSGFLAHRFLDLRGMEVLLADGSLVKSGFWNLGPSERELNHFSYGMGPDWRGLFSQSNLGIVTKAVINLYPKKEFQKMLWIKVNQTELPGLIDKLSDLYQRNYIHSVTHIGNDKRMKIENKNQGQLTVWTAMALIQGSKNFVEFLEKEIPQYLENQYISMGFLTEREAQDQELGEVFGCHVGRTTDFFVRAMYQSEGAILEKENWQIDYGKYGMLCCLPILPANAPDIQKATEILDGIFDDFGIMPAATLNPMNDLHLESVINIYFDRNQPQEVEKAHKANNEMIARFYKAGYRFYRFDVKTMHDYIDQNNPHWQLIDKLKNALDPNRILSPGRYEAKVD